MKLKFYRRIFSILSFLTDKTNGVPILIKYKLIVGSVIVALANTSCQTNRNPYVTCYDISIIEEDTTTIEKELTDSIRMDGDQIEMDENKDL